jgi:hypothetical protein
MSLSDFQSAWGLVNRALPAAGSEDNYKPLRVSRRGELYTQPVGAMRQALTAQGTYWVAHNNTNDASTTLAGHAAPVLADADATMTKALVFCRNTAGTTSSVLAYLDYIEIEVVTAGANGTSMNWAAQLDTGSTRYSSGTVETLTVVNPNMQSTASPSLVTLAGPVTVAAEGASVRHLGHGQIRAAIEFAGDRTTFAFGGDPHSGFNVVAGAASRHYVNMPPVVLGPTDQFLLALYAPSQSAAGVYKVRMGWWEV